MTSLTTFRVDSENITTDPAERTDGDETTWAFDPATGLELRKTYADNSGVVKTYDAYNRLATETDARGNVKTHSYETARGLHLGTTYSDGTTARAYDYNHLGQLTQITDDAGTRTIGYNIYGEVETDSLSAGGVTHLITETRDDLGRSTGFTYAKNGTLKHTVTTGYGTDGRIASAGFLHGGEEKRFGYSYVAGSNLLHKLTMPNNMTLTQSYEETRDLLTGMYYKRGTSGVVEREYTYDTLGRPLTRTTSRQGRTMNDTFGYNTRSELTAATVSGENYGYNYDNIGNRNSAAKGEDVTRYTANALNQYTAIQENEQEAFIPQFDADGNQTLVKTGTGIWSVVYNAENRPVSFTRTGEDGTTVIECSYDSMGRRATKKVTTNGSVTLHQRYIYRGYLQIACCDLTRSAHPDLWLITWDPTQPVATRPLAIQKNGTWYTYGWDLTKNICEVFRNNGYIGTAYSYTPFGKVTASGNVEQPIQWSSEFYDSELGLVYYNYRYLNPMAGRWLRRDPANTYHLYAYPGNPTMNYDVLGLLAILECIRYKWQRGDNVRLTSICLLAVANPGKDICCKCSKEMSKLRAAKDSTSALRQMWEVLNCLKSNSKGHLTIDSYSPLVANLGTHHENTMKGDGRGRSQRIPAGMYRILPGVSQTYKDDQMPGITGLDRTKPGSPVAGRGMVWIHHAWGDVRPANETEGCLAFTNGDDAFLKKAMLTNADCGGMYLIMRDGGDALPEDAEKFNTASDKVTNSPTYSVPETIIPSKHQETIMMELAAQSDFVDSMKVK